MIDKLREYLKSPGTYAFELKETILLDRLVGGSFVGSSSAPQRFEFRPGIQAGLTGDVRYGFGFEMPVIVNMTDGPAFDITGVGQHFEGFQVVNNSVDGVGFLVRYHRTVGAGKQSYQNVSVIGGKAGWQCGTIEGKQANGDLQFWMNCGARSCRSAILALNDQSVGHKAFGFDALDCGTVFDFRGGGNVLVHGCNAIRCQRILNLDRQRQAGYFQIDGLTCDQDMPAVWTLIESTAGTRATVTVSGITSKSGGTLRVGPNVKFDVGRFINGGMVV